MEDSSQGAVVSESVGMLLRSDAVHNRLFQTVPEKITQQSRVHLHTSAAALQIVKMYRLPRC